MSAEANVELVRRLYELHNRGADAVLAAYEQLCHPDTEWVPAVVGGAEGRSYRGREGLARWYREREEAFEDASVEIEECRAVGEDVVLLLGRSRARGRASGIEMDEKVGILIHIRDGLIQRNQAFGSHRQAEEAASRAVELRA